MNKIPTKILTILSTQDGLTSTDIAKQLRSSGKVTSNDRKYLTLLETHGFITSVEEDMYSGTGFRRLYFITEKGREQVPTKWYAQFSCTDQMTFNRLLQALDALETVTVEIQGVV